jgi:hypothetical protein
MFLHGAWWVQPLHMHLAKLGAQLLQTGDAREKTRALFSLLLVGCAHLAKDPIQRHLAALDLLPQAL